ncbi:LysR substrate-binding domain-containing protein [Labrenzia sp. 011]|uniref:LysR substrate-binding domain-containing protein n=1 Tax=Labrenzia sp. 011 TaxID=2171494 RepID=UPI0014041249|nr:LysR substrate-binding domain-containing protein [Labrenzia sp. 011]
MNFIQMRAFTAVARLGSISAAAVELGVSKPAIAMQIKSLEEALCARLFHRKGHSLEISEVGQRFLEPAMLMAAVLDRIDALTAETTGKKGGVLRVGACAPFVLMPLMAAFSKRYPEIGTHIEIANSQVLVGRVRDHELDIGIATAKKPFDDFFCVHLASQTVRLVVARTDPLSERMSISIEELADMPVILREVGSMTRQIAEDALAEQGLELNSRFVFGSREAVKEAIANGLGAGLVLDKEIGRDPALTSLEITGADLSAREYLFCHKDLATLGTAGAFIDIASENSDLPVAPLD